MRTAHARAGSSAGAVVQRTSGQSLGSIATALSSIASASSAMAAMCHGPSRPRRAMQRGVGALALVLWACAHGQWWAEPASAAGAPRIIGLVPVRNEEARIGFCLHALALVADAVIVLDDNSDDRTVEVVQGLAAACKVAQIITKDAQGWFRNETGDRNLLLQAGRAHGGTHFIVLDADEAFTGNLVDSGELRAQILDLRVGQSLALHWIQLWKSIHYYRADRLFDGQGRQHGILGSACMACIFHDDGVAEYEGDFIHTRRIPEALSWNSLMIKDLEVGLMHFQFVNWPNFILKQAWYKSFERVRLPDKPVGEINVLYSGSLDTIGERATAVNPSWFARYEEWMDARWLEAVSLTVDRWRLPMFDAWVAAHGAHHFGSVGVWDMLQSVNLLEVCILPGGLACCLAGPSSFRPFPSLPFRRPFSCCVRPVHGAEHWCRKESARALTGQFSGRGPCKTPRLLECAGSSGRQTRGRSGRGGGQGAGGRGCRWLSPLWDRRPLLM